jgi:hypothetical protein
MARSSGEGALFHMPGTRVRRRYTYLVWPYGYQTAVVACASLASALHERAHVRFRKAGDVWVVRSDGCAVQRGCTFCHRKVEAVLIPCHPVLLDYWCPPCSKLWGKRIMSRRRSTLQEDIMRWLVEDTRRVNRVLLSDHAALVKAINADKGNISKSLRNLAAQHYIILALSPGGYTTGVQLTPLGSYVARSLL